MPPSTACSMTSAMPSSNRAPLVTRRSASSIASAWRADGAKSCGSLPAGMTTSTSAASPTTWLTTSPRMFVVTTIDGRPLAVASSSSPHAAVPASRPHTATRLRIRLIPGYARAIAAEPTTDERAIALDGVAIARGGRTVLGVESLRIGPGLTVLVGPNGSGKSTLLHAIAGLLDVAGSVTVLGTSPLVARPRVAYVLQAQQLPERLLVTAREVVALARAARLGPFRRFQRRDHDAVDAALDRLELTDLAGRHLAELSGGQRQRVFLAQGLAQEADVLLLDEPVAGLDLASSGRIAAVIDDERRRGRIVVVATHDLDEAGRADQAVLLAGRVVAHGSPSDVLVPANLRAAYGGRLVDLGGGRFLTDDDDAHDHAH